MKLKWVRRHFVSLILNVSYFWSPWIVWYYSSTREEDKRECCFDETKTSNFLEDNRDCKLPSSERDSDEERKIRKEIHCGQHFIIQKEYFLITKLFPISLPSQCRCFFFILLHSFMSRVAYNFFPLFLQCQCSLWFSRDCHKKCRWVETANDIFVLPSTH
jgi:hypothetical protein